MSALTGFITGLSNSLNSYLGMQNQLSAQSAMKQKEMDYASQVRMNELQQEQPYKLAQIDYQQQSELNRQKGLEGYKNSLMGHVDPNAAERVAPGVGASAVSNFQKTNSRLPTVEEFDTMIKHHPKLNGSSNTTNPDTLATLLEGYGAEPEEIERARSIKQPLSAGVTEMMLKPYTDKGITESAAAKLFQEAMPSRSISKNPEEFSKQVQEFRTNLNEPGKLTLSAFAKTQNMNEDQAFEKLIGAADATMKKALDDGKSPNEVLVLGSRLLKPYEKKVKALGYARLRQEVRKLQQQ